MAGALMIAAPSVARAAAGAETCRIVDRDTADRAVALLDGATKVLHDDWFAPIAVSKAAWRRRGFRYEVVVNGRVGLDLGATYLPAPGGGEYRNLGPLVGCPSSDWPKAIPANPFGPASDAGVSAPTRPTVIGILELPELEAAWYDPGHGPARPVPVRREAEPAAPLLAAVARLEELPLLEYGYEQRGPIVVERRPGWYRIELGHGRGWVAAADAGRFHPLAELVRDGLSYLTPSWSGRLWSRPDVAAERRDLASAWRWRLGPEVPAEVLETRPVGEVLWLDVAIRWPSPCAGPENPRVVARGWLPAYGASGAPNVWFYSRGC